MSRTWPFTVLALLAVLGVVLPAAAQESVQDSSPLTPASAASLATPPQGDMNDSKPSACFGFTGEFLYLWANRDGLGTAVVSNTQNGITVNSLEPLSWDGTPAFRVSGYYRFPGSEVQLAAEFTYFHVGTQRTVSAPEGGSLLGTLATDPRAADATTADSDAALSYALLDLDASTSIRINDLLGLRVFGGVRLTSINQTLKSIYSGGALDNESDYVDSPVRFYGAGLTAGAEATARVYKGFGLYGRARLGLVYGAFSSQRTETVDSVFANAESETYYTAVPVAELAAGISYEGSCWSIRAGYEMTDWLNMVDGIGGPGPDGGITERKRGDLTLQALALKFGFAF